MWSALCYRTAAGPTEDGGRIVRTRLSSPPRFSKSAMSEAVTPGSLYYSLIRYLL